MRWGGPLYGLEGRRLRNEEVRHATRAVATFLATAAESELLQRIAPSAQCTVMGNGVNLDYFHPSRHDPIPELDGREFIVFVGVMDYFPNVDAALWFTESVFCTMRTHYPKLEFMIVGRNPAGRLRKLSGRDGVVVTGGVADVRPYIAAAKAVVAPLRLARGIQNTVLEALSMGKPVLASREVCTTFGPSLPVGLIRCASALEYIDNYRKFSNSDLSSLIRKDAEMRFDWNGRVAPISSLLAGRASLTRSPANEILPTAQ